MKARDITRLKVGDLNENLTCKLCSGYLIDATTLVVCQEPHSFCRSCILRHFESDENKTCPICKAEVKKNQLRREIRADHTLQDLVYKLVPGLYKRELKRRQEFYAELCESEKKDSDSGKPTNTRTDGSDSKDKSRAGGRNIQIFDRHLVELATFICTPDEIVSLSVEYAPAPVPQETEKVVKKEGKESQGQKTEQTEPTEPEKKEHELEKKPAKPSKKKGGKKNEAKNETSESTETGQSTKAKKKSKKKKEKPERNFDNLTFKRYFRCPAAVTVGHLKKLLRYKLELPSNYQIEMLHSDEPLHSELTLVDVAYIYCWRRKAPMQLFFNICKFEMDESMDIMPQLTREASPPPKLAPLSVVQETAATSSNKREDTDKADKKPVATSLMEPKPTDSEQQSSSDKNLVKKMSESGSGEIKETKSTSGNVTDKKAEKPQKKVTKKREKKPQPSKSAGRPPNIADSVIAAVLKAATAEARSSPASNQQEMTPLTKQKSPEIWDLKQKKSKSKSKLEKFGESQLRKLIAGSSAPNLSPFMLSSEIFQGMNPSMNLTTVSSPSTAGPANSEKIITVPTTAAATVAGATTTTTATVTTHTSLAEENAMVTLANSVAAGILEQEASRKKRRKPTSPSKKPKKIPVEEPVSSSSSNFVTDTSMNNGGGDEWIRKLLASAIVSPADYSAAPPMAKIAKMDHPTSSFSPTTTVPISATGFADTYSAVTSFTLAQNLAMNAQRFINAQIPRRSGTNHSWEHSGRLLNTLTSSLMAAKVETTKSPGCTSAPVVEKAPLPFTAITSPLLSTTLTPSIENATTSPSPLIISTQNSSFSRNSSTLSLPPAITCSSTAPVRPIQSAPTPSLVYGMSASLPPPSLLAPSQKSVLSIPQSAASAPPAIRTPAILPAITSGSAQILNGNFAILTSGGTGGNRTAGPGSNGTGICTPSTRTLGVLVFGDAPVQVLNGSRLCI